MIVTTLQLRGELAERIRAHGRQSYPHECCGALLGSDDDEREVHDIFPLVNRRDDSPQNRFSITAEDFRTAERAASAAGLSVVGWYHSHPDHPALPSEYDREHAWPWYSYLILSVEQGEPKTMASWRLSDDRIRFVPERIVSEAARPAAAAEPQ
jgi:proteasome lid subunit RPN8/RPN11